MLPGSAVYFVTKKQDITRQTLQVAKAVPHPNHCRPREIACVPCGVKYRWGDGQLDSITKLDIFVKKVEQKDKKFAEYDIGIVKVKGSIVSTLKTESLNCSENMS